MSQSTLTINLEDGATSGVVSLRKTDWKGSALSFARHDFVERADLRKRLAKDGGAGVYMLVGETDEGKPQIYVGETGSNVYGRLDIHSKPEENNGKAFWTRALVFGGLDDDLGKSEVVLVEKELIKIASAAAAADRGTVENKNGVIKPTATAKGDGATDAGGSIAIKPFLAGLLELLPFMGVTLFEPLASRNQELLLTCTGPSANAEGYETSAGFVVTAGSKARADEVSSFPPSRKNQRASLIQSGVLTVDGDSLTFTADYQFSSPSAAASVVLARSANGRAEWKDSSGQTLEQLADKALGSTA